MKVAHIILSLACIFNGAEAFAPTQNGVQRTGALQMADEVFDFEVNMPPKNSGLAAQMKIKPILDQPSELVEVRYQIPFGLNVEPKNGMAVCTQAGEGGEQVGDVLRFTSQYTMGLPRGDGLVSTAASFSGAIGWQCSLFDVTKANTWEEVVEALVSNTPQRTDEVVLIFERKVADEES
ncbi:hypothetical protein CTEN210_16696 [Chaetoceros tenuissimus]|uniref:Uncharacterized protein n=1 Tax=Chaetoceros tenuissimus TaxID=426638 RepID=A0AAD3DC26_9STRA|nr:hypothetical protein CTEN210_16696 [Chaetoceros tenuissimus]